jgi:lysophospholipase L1-like esterase
MRAFFAAATVAVVLLIAPSASAAPSYLALGESLTAGGQLGPGGFYLSPGYTGLVTQLLRRSIPDLQLVNYGCPGATTDSFMRAGRCAANPHPYGNWSQLAAAEHYLRTNRGQVKLVTIGLGANDIAPCAKVGGSKKFVCLRAVLAKAMANMEVIAGRLRAAAGPDVAVVGLTYYNPFLVLYFKGAKGKAEAQLSVAIIRRYMNLPLSDIYRRYEFKVADVATAFGTYRPFSETVQVDAYGRLPVAVAAICLFTRVCSKPPDIHANDLGYTVMAFAVAAALRPPAR